MLDSKHPSRYEVASDARGQIYKGASLINAFKALRREMVQCEMNEVCFDAVFYRDSEPMKIQEDDDGNFSFESE